jgi:SNF2 family DNA or RNA helicase
MSLTGQTLYVNNQTGTITLDKPLCPAQPLLRGGILADAMGLGKTAMLAALICAHPFDPLVPDVSANGQLMRKETRPPVRIKATLVVVTDAIESQWAAELKRWAPGLEVLRAPAAFADCASEAAVLEKAGSADVVIITYSRLTELRRLSVQRITTSAARVLCYGVSWWRTVLDEAQTVFSASSATSKAVSWLWKSNVWCTTGTPLSNDLRDVHGIFEMLDCDPVRTQMVCCCSA